MKRILTSILLLVTCLSSYSQITNAAGVGLNFTNSSLPGWTLSSGGTQNPTGYGSEGVGASIVSSMTNFQDGQYNWTIKPYTGQYMVSLQPGYSSASYSAMDTALGLNSTSISSIQNFLNSHSGGGATNPTNASWMYYSGLSLNAGTTFSLAWNFVATDYTPWNDTSITTLVPTSGGGLATINNVLGQYSILGAINPGSGNYSTNSYGSTGWELSTYTVNTTGIYTLGFGSFNLGDTVNSPILLVSGSQGTTYNGTTPVAPVAPNPGSSAPATPPPPPPAPAGPKFTDLKFSGNQIADTQWNVGSCTNAGGTNCQIYSKNPGPTWNLGGPIYPSSTQYIAFQASGDSTYPWHMYLYNNDGSFVSDLGIGRILSEGMGSDGHHYFFFSNANYNGTLFSTDWGMNNTDGVTINGTNSPTVPQTNDFASTGSTTPLASGQTAGGGSSAPTVTSTTTTDSVSSSSNTTTSNVTNQYTNNIYNYSFTGAIIETVTTTNTTPVTTTHYSDGTSTTSNGTTVTTTNAVDTYTITPNQTLTPADRNTFRGTLVNSITINQPMGSANNAIQATQKGTGNNIEMTVSGVNNKVSANQGFTVNSIGTPSESTIISNNNFAALSVYGNNNNVTSQQTGLMNSTILGVTGNYNTLTSTQNGNNNQSYASINGNNNTTSVNQNGNNNISAITAMGPGNNITVGQTGNSNGALISVANQGGASTVNLIQQAITQGQTFVVQQTCTNGAGCSVSVQQNK